MNKALTVFTLFAAASLPLTAGAAAYKVVDVTNGGTITGKVTFSGSDPAPKIYPITKDNDTCGTGNREIDFVRVTNGALNDSVVYLKKVKSGKDFPAELNKPEVDQKKCNFIPFLSVMKNKDKLAVHTSDPVLHNIHTYELIGKAKKTVFNVSQPPELTVINKTVKLKRGTSMKLECDAHDFMHGYVFVAKNPYFAVVKEDGSFVIDNVPPGKYKIAAWHGFLGEKKGKVTVDAGGTATIDFAYKGR
ncbi:MAG TPA: hypothetical protein ENJ17_01480 [Gammaproteobacteria bacterium]|nr:hypothetical protein [Gammaproteobacteria bacterium]